MRHARYTLIVPTLAVATLVLAGCGGGAGAGDAGASKGSTAKTSPLAEYMGGMMGGGTPEEQQKTQLKKQAEMEKIAAACMKKDGFEYTPVEYDEEDFSVTAGSDYEDPEWVAEYGYGIVNNPWNEGGENEDPNEEYRSGLSESMQAAYSEALYGQIDEEEDPEAMQSTLPEGCYGEALQTVYEKEAKIMEDERFISLQTKMGKIYEKLAKDPTVAKLDQEWVDCMADAGYDYTNPNDPWDEIYAEMGGSFGMDGTDGEAAQPELSDAELKELAAKEVKIATADLNCKKELKYTEKSQAVEFALEEEFIEQNKSELEEMKAAYAEL